MNSNNYRYNQTNQQFRVSPWGQQNRSSNNSWMNYSKNNFWSSPHPGGNETPNNSRWVQQKRPTFKNGDKPRLSGSQKRKNLRAKYTAKKKNAAEAAPKGILMAVVPSDFPETVMTNGELDKLQNDILKEIDNVAADSFRPKFLTSYKRRGMFMISCFNSESVDWLKTTIEKPEPSFERQLKVIKSEDLPEYKNIQISIPNSPEDPETLLKRLVRQNPGLSTKGWHMIHHRVEEEIHNLKISVEESVIKTLEEMGLKLFVNFSRVEVKVLGRTGDGIKSDMGRVVIQKKETTEEEMNSVQAECGGTEVKEEVKEVEENDGYNANQDEN